MIKFASYLLLSVATTCAVVSLLPCEATNEFLDEVSELADPNAAAPSIESTDVGYDLHKDMFYFSDDLVERAYKRNRYADTKVTLAGQVPSMTGNRVAQAVHPFAVGQKSAGISGSSADRWDVKQDAKGHQYLALYHAYNSHFVVNKLRAHLLRRVANAVKNYLPVLDQTHELAENGGQEGYINKVRVEITALIGESFQAVDEEIRDQLKSSDDSGASATVVIVTQYYVIVASAGEGKVVAYDGSQTISELSSKYAGLNANNLFGAKKSRPVGPCEPVVQIHQRFQKDEDDYDYDIQLLLIETPIVANSLSNEEAMKTVLNEVKLHKSNPGAEQDLYTNSVTNILQNVAKKGGLMNKLSNTDYSAVLVGLQTDYKRIF